MQTMDSALMTLVENGEIEGLDAYHQSNNKDKFKEFLPEEDNDPSVDTHLVNE
jgi:Tfp pilus assembly ATPase PilU